MALLDIRNVTRRFEMPVQPQLVLLQKTLLQIEGLGRQLDPDLDLRRAAQPILERFMSEQMGVRGFLRHMRAEAPLWAAAFPQFPRLVHRMLADDAPRRLEKAILDLARVQRRQSQILGFIAAVLALLVTAVFLRM